MMSARGARVVSVRRLGTRRILDVRLAPGEFRSSARVLMPQLQGDGFALVEFLSQRAMVVHPQDSLT